MRIYCGNTIDLQPYTLLHGSNLSFMFRLLKVQTIFCSYSTLEKVTLPHPQISAGLPLVAIFHLAHPRPLTRGFFNVRDYLTSFWNAWIIVGGYSSVIRAHGALIGKDCHRFGRRVCDAGDSFKSEWEWEKILLLQAWQGTQTNFELNLHHKTTAPPSPPACSSFSPHWLFGGCTHAFHAGVSRPHKIHSDEAKCGCFAHLRCHTRFPASVCVASNLCRAAGQYPHQAKTNELLFELIVTRASVCAAIFILSYLIRLFDFDVSFSGNSLANIFFSHESFVDNVLHVKWVVCHILKSWNCKISVHFYWAYHYWLFLRQHELKRTNGIQS